MERTKFVQRNDPNNFSRLSKLSVVRFTDKSKRPLKLLKEEIAEVTLSRICGVKEMKDVRRDNPKEFNRSSKTVIEMLYGPTQRLINETVTVTGRSDDSSNVFGKV